MIPGLNDGLDFQSQALVLRAQRQRLIASNIANADTPGYQARDFDFATALRNATGSGGVGSGIGAGIAGGGSGGTQRLTIACLMGFWEFFYSPSPARGQA